MEQEKTNAENFCFTEPKFDITSAVDCGGEYIMPDYFPEIRKIVSCTASALPDSKFLSGENLEYGGTLAFTVLYIGNDGALVSLPYATEYSGKCQLPAEVKGTGEIAVDAAAEDIQCRVLAPRKVSLRSKVRCNIYADSRREYHITYSDGESAPLSLAEKSTVQSLTKIIPVMCGGRGAVTGSASGELRENKGSKPVSCAGAVNITEVRCRKDAVNVRGEAVVRCLVFSSDGVYRSAKAVLPFEETVTAAGCKEGDACRAWGRAASVTVTEGEDGVLKAEAEYDLEAEWSRAQQLTVTEDAYSTGWSAVSEKSEFQPVSALCCTSSSLTVSGSGKRTTKPQNGEYLVDMTCEGVLTGAEQKENKLTLTGKCNVKAYIAADGEVICEEMSLPVKFETNAMSQAGEGKLVVRSHVSTTDINGRLEGDTFFANCELCISVSVRRQAKATPVTKVVFDRNSPISRNTAQIKVFYPSSEETVWNIAKKYLAPADKIEKVNGISRYDVARNAVLIPER